MLFDQTPCFGILQASIHLPALDSPAAGHPRPGTSKLAPALRIRSRITRLLKRPTGGCRKSWAFLGTNSLHRPGQATHTSTPGSISRAHYLFMVSRCSLCEKPRKSYAQEIRCGPEPDQMPALDNEGLESDGVYHRRRLNTGPVRARGTLPRALLGCGADHQPEDCSLPLAHRFRRFFGLMSIQDVPGRLGI